MLLHDMEVVCNLLSTSLKKEEEQLGELCADCLGVAFSVVCLVCTLTKGPINLYIASIHFHSGCF